MVLQHTMPSPGSLQGPRRALICLTGFSSCHPALHFALPCRMSPFNAVARIGEPGRRLPTPRGDKDYCFTRSVSGPGEETLTPQSTLTGQTSCRNYATASFPSSVWLSLVASNCGQRGVANSSPRTRRGQVGCEDFLEGCYEETFRSAPPCMTFEATDK